MEDVLEVCSGKKRSSAICAIFSTSVDDPVLKKGREIRRRWLLDMLEQHGPCAKIAYLDEKPVAQILFYPEETIPYLHSPRKDVINLKCIEISSPKDRGKGVGSSLLKAFIDDCHKGIDCLRGRPCRFVVTKPFPAEGDLPMADFYGKYGFKQGDREMFLEVKGKYVPRKIPEFRPLPEDYGKIIAPYHPVCEWGYFAQVKTKENLKRKCSVEIFNSWEKPEEYKKRGGGWLLTAGGWLVNAEIITWNDDMAKHFWIDQKAFIRDVEEALRK